MLVNLFINGRPCLFSVCSVCSVCSPKLANDCQVPPSVVTEYVGLLEDTLVEFLLPAWTR